MFDFTWVRTVFAYTEEEVLQIAGWDAVVYLRILRFGARALRLSPSAFMPGFMTLKRCRMADL